MTPALRPGRMPDPARAHGAWVYLAVSILAGALAALGKGSLPALLSGLGFAGVFLVASSVALGAERGRGRGVLGLSIALASPLLALELGAPISFFAYSLIALFPAAAAAWFATRQGFHSPAALSFGVAALVVAAPASACAGGATAPTSWALLALLAPFFAWRTFRLRSLMVEEKGWGRSRLRALGLREAGLSVGWTFLALLLIHLLLI